MSRPKDYFDNALTEVELLRTRTRSEPNLGPVYYRCSGLLVPTSIPRLASLGLACPSQGIATGLCLDIRCPEILTFLSLVQSAPRVMHHFYPSFFLSIALCPLSEHQPFTTIDPSLMINPSNADCLRTCRWTWTTDSRPNW